MLCHWWLKDDTKVVENKQLDNKRDPISFSSFLTATKGATLISKERKYRSPFDITILTFFPKKLKSDKRSAYCPFIRCLRCSTHRGKAKKQYKILTSRFCSRHKINGNLFSWKDMVYPRFNQFIVLLHTQLSKARSRLYKCKWFWEGPLLFTNNTWL